jgi:flagellar basal-body rod protein FlgB
VSDLTSALVIKALDGLLERSVITANNIANAGSPNFRAGRVNFEDALAQAATRGRTAVSAVRPQVLTDPVGSDVRLDLELASASTTATRYAALIDVLDRELQMGALAITRNN